MFTHDKFFKQNGHVKRVVEVFNPASDEGVHACFYRESIMLNFVNSIKTKQAHKYRNSFTFVGVYQYPVSLQEVQCSEYC